MLIFNISVKGSRMRKIAHEIGQRMPLLSINQKKACGKGIPDLTNVASMKNPRSTTRFIILDETKNGINVRAVSELMMIIKSLSMAQSRPKCLIIHFSNDIHKPDYEKFLQNRWSNLFHHRYTNSTNKRS